MSSLIRRIALAAVVVLGATACQITPKTRSEPIASAMLMRNRSLFDINVYAVLPSGDREWLTTVPAKGQRSLPVEPRMLRPGEKIVLQAQAIGSTSTWTSNELGVDPTIVAVLDLVATRGGDCSQSLLYTVDLLDIQAAMK